VDSQLVRRYLPDGGREPPADRLPRRVQAGRPEPHLAQPDHARGIQGNEYNKWSTKETPEHRATLPFTRVLAGPADYTPGGFINKQPAQFRNVQSNTQVQGTRASELAMFILIESPFTVACDSYKNYKDQDGKYLLGMDFLKGLPTVWTRPTAWPVRWENTSSRRGATGGIGIWPRSPTAMPANCRCL